MTQTRLGAGQLKPAPEMATDAEVVAALAQHRADEGAHTQYVAKSELTALQRAMYTKNAVMWMPNSGANISNDYGTTWVVRKNGSSAAQARPGISNSNAVTRMFRNTFGTGTTTTGTIGVFSTDAVAMMGNSVTDGGFNVFIRFALEAYLSTERVFIGLSENVAALNGNPSALTNSIGISKDSADSTLQFCTRGNGAGNGAGTKINTGVTPNVSQIYDLLMYAVPDSPEVTLTLLNAVTQTVLAVTTITVNVPTIGTPMYLQALIQSTTGTVSKQLALSKMYLETEL